MDEDQFYFTKNLKLKIVKSEKSNVNKKDKNIHLFSFIISTFIYYNLYVRTIEFLKYKNQ